MALSRLKTLSIIVASVLVAACDDDISGPGPTGFAFAGARLECVGPLSETGVGIYLATRPVQSVRPPTPYARIVIRRPVASVVGSWAVTGGGAQATAWHHTTGTNEEIATSGSITVNRVNSDDSIDGWADLTFPTAGRVGGNFRAYWISGDPGCL